MKNGVEPYLITDGAIASAVDAGLGGIRNQTGLFGTTEGQLRDYGQTGEHADAGALARAPFDERVACDLETAHDAPG
ncbi:MULTISPECIES: hypothetical protein [unclassified Pandoraea]|uniref:hypothetical protein n=1 Tax=unclassified Pandoraea TaxID=2624094 RepID=UPI000477BF13|nr:MULTISPECIES: hypothetical protein [unclassified Pandoraea]OJY19663.1 MAG: hypothetical protein BGP02_07925 [Pandoraea sp. 64-18]